MMEIARAMLGFTFASLFIAWLVHFCYCFYRYIKVHDRNDHENSIFWFNPPFAFMVARGFVGKKRIVQLNLRLSMAVLIVLLFIAFVLVVFSVTTTDSVPF